MLIKPQYPASSSGVSVMGRALKLDMEGMKQRGTGGGGERIVGTATAGGSKFNEGENPVSRETRENRSFSSSFSRGGSAGRSSAGRGSGRGGGGSYGRGGGGRSFGRGDGRGRGRGGGRGDGRGRGGGGGRSFSSGGGGAGDMN